MATKKCKSCGKQITLRDISEVKGVYRCKKCGGKVG